MMRFYAVSGSAARQRTDILPERRNLRIDARETVQRHHMRLRHIVQPRSVPAKGPAPALAGRRIGVVHRRRRQPLQTVGNAQQRLFHPFVHALPLAPGVPFEKPSSPV